MTNNYYKKSYITSNKQTKRKPKQNKPEYLKLFLGAFFMMLILFILLAVHLFASVDTAIGENDEGDIKESGLGVKHLIDSRLKFIQMEDRNMLPSNKAPEVDAQKEKEISTYNNTDEVKVEPYTRTSQEFAGNNGFSPSQSSFSESTKATIPTPQAIKPTNVVYKVYIGTYGTLEQARIAQNIIQDANLGVTSFVKTLGNETYTVQVGSYADYTKASALTNELKRNHFPARLVQE